MIIIYSASIYSVSVIRFIEILFVYDLLLRIYLNSFAKSRWQQNIQNKVNININMNHSSMIASTLVQCSYIFWNVP